MRQDRGAQMDHDMYNVHCTYTFYSHSDIEQRQLCSEYCSALYIYVVMVYLAFCNQRTQFTSPDMIWNNTFPVVVFKLQLSSSLSDIKLYPPTLWVLCGQETDQRLHSSTALSLCAACPVLNTPTQFFTQQNVFRLGFMLSRLPIGGALNISI